MPTLQEEKNLDFTDVGGGVLNKATLNPIALQYFALYPAPGLSGVANNYVSASVQRQNSETFDVRVDQRINDNNNIFGRYSYNNTQTVNPGGLPAVNGIVPDGGITAPELVQNAMGNFTHIFTPSVLLELKAAYTRIDLDTTLANNGKNLSTQFGLAAPISTELQRAHTHATGGLRSLWEMRRSTRIQPSTAHSSSWALSLTPRASTA